MPGRALRIRVAIARSPFTADQRAQSITLAAPRGPLATSRDASGRASPLPARETPRSHLGRHDKPRPIIASQHAIGLRIIDK